VRKKINIATTVLISVGLILLGVFVFHGSYIRLIEGFRDFGLSAGYYFCEVFGIDHGITPTVNGISEVASPSVSLPSDWNGFKNGAKSYFALLFNKDNFIGWLRHISGVIENLSKILVIILPCILLMIIVIKALYGRGNNYYGKDTVPLKVFKAISKVTYQPIKSFVKGYVAFIKENGWIWKVWLAVLLLHFNLATIFVEFLAYYFYFAVTFDFSTLYVQFVKLFKDLKTPFMYFPYWLLLPLPWYVFNRIRSKMALSKLRRFEARNCGFINELPIVSMSCGSMGKKKTTLITDMALSQEVMFRQMALEILQSCDMKFPCFPWICFENELRACMEHKTVYNLAGVKKWVKLKLLRYIKHKNSAWQLYGYDIKRYGANFNDELKISSLFDVLEKYALAYFVYVVEGSLIVSNYSIRTDNRLLNDGNFPMWVMDFFPEGITRGRHAHIMDFDAFRLGKKIIENNPHTGSFEFGVVVISEVGKERGNNLELREVKKGTDETNQKNDLFNAWLKMCRHSATIDSFPFIKVFTDEQRPESWGADARDLCDIIHIISSDEQRLALPFYTVENMLADWAFSHFINLYYDFRFRRGDNTLLVHILKSVTAWIWKRNLRVYNRYGYSVLHIETERGTMDGKAENKKYFLMNKKIYSRRFSTDCFSDYFNELAKKSKVGLSDYMEYVAEKATVEELKQQHSYFINSLYGEV